MPASVTATAAARTEPPNSASPPTTCPRIIMTTPASRATGTAATSSSASSVTAITNLADRSGIPSVRHLVITFTSQDPANGPPPQEQDDMSRPWGQRLSRSKSSVTVGCDQEIQLAEDLSGLLRIDWRDDAEGVFDSGGDVKAEVFAVAGADDLDDLRESAGDPNGDSGCGQAERVDGGRCPHAADGAGDGTVVEVAAGGERQIGVDGGHDQRPLLLELAPSPRDR